ncbi:hypothetical protein [Kibdelosporangium phytohabitans]|uniref:Uncharacterized protein n=1 Tax=Kibdelosporangium phytohabitans TaxID=860235 RepID=A0A0N9I5V3_9PSEU|nr:hypothetical protein [Kibdelosporangium phytohabitans]ALG11504.1 hypothetical protein AOZ06_35700 [Kibdelosporangium phytohabitans]MBE1462857.1 hypothetical protein [Kibdelosporangium phytohabitans]
MLIEMQRVLANGLAMRDKVVHGAEADDPVPSHRLVSEAIRVGGRVRGEVGHAGPAGQGQCRLRPDFRWCDRVAAPGRLSGGVTE